MEKWQDVLSSTITDVETLSKFVNIDKKRVKKVTREYPLGINPYYLSLIKKHGGPIWKQCIPDSIEIIDKAGRSDPLMEEKYTPMKGLVHRYRDRVLLVVSNMCAGYCRFCTRKRKIGLKDKIIKKEEFKKVLRYIKRRKYIRDVIISGGDPLLIHDDMIEHYLKELKKIKHVQIIRIDSRTPCVLPQRITPRLCNIFKSYQPIYFNTHFNHYYEITRQSRRACNMLADAGVVMGNQTVLMHGVNDDVNTLKRLFEELLKIRVRPYYLYLPDAVRGTYHFRVSIKRARRIMRGLIGHTSGLAIPHLIVDLKHGGGKTPILPKYIIKQKGKRYVFKNFEGKKYFYADVE
ncbi:MAG: KamA family radical SAM protein [Candidatus Omnitrophica bacterium]|nr:KamA family radical SAM protein [Candidatus Omnitrophota bacterium]MBU4590913.1 KamA family radical SAM protein [Candidatus Omnitrophota bacterium]